MRHGKTASAPTTEAGRHELQRRDRELAILKVIAEGLNCEVDLDRALHVGLSQVVAWFDLRTGWIRPHFP